jgi:hypothetical protein
MHTLQFQGTFATKFGFTEFYEEGRECSLEWHGMSYATSDISWNLEPTKRGLIWGCHSPVLTYLEVNPELLILILSDITFWA